MHWQSLVKYTKYDLYLRTRAILDKFMPFVYNHGIKELIAHYHDSIHNREYQNFYYRGSLALLVDTTQPTDKSDQKKASMLHQLESKLTHM